MMKIYTVGKSDDILIKELGFDMIEMPTISTDDELHDFIEAKLSDIDFNALIIPINKVETTIAFRLALHIRLTEKLWTKRLVPILFISIQSLGTVLRDAGIYGHILATKGCRFEQFKSVEIIKRAIERIEALSTDDFFITFLKQISVQPDEKVGRHSIANQWGALILDKVANTKTLNTNKDLIDAQKKLYFKYTLALNYDYNKLNAPQKQIIDLEQLNPSKTINSDGFKILLIDDEADKGWKDVLKKVFKNATVFETISEKVKDFNDFSSGSKNIINNESFDLYLIDLRLSGFDEENTINPEAFSGTKILKHIKTRNKGSQVVIFTASNKAWNMKTLLEEGADGYYIKESPEYNFPLSFSKENYSNFEKEVRKCFQLIYLKDIFIIQQKCLVAIERNFPSRSESYQKFYDRAKSSLEIAFELLKKSANDKKYFNLAFLTYYQILEDYSSQKDNFEYNYDRVEGDCVVKKEGTLIKVIVGSSKTWYLEYVPSNNQHYSFYKRGTIPQSKGDSRQSFPKISFLLAFKFEKNDSYLKEKWSKLNWLRNDKAGHGGDGGFVTIEEIKELLAIVELFLTNQ